MIMLVAMTTNHPTTISYEREINRRETPAIRMILEELELPLLPLVLCVIDMSRKFSYSSYYVFYLKILLMSLERDGVLRLTDGWYIVNAQLDKPLEELYIKRQLKPGDKIVIGAIQASAV
jgi:hypothetical protein